jgi:hypothetical protein
MLPSPAPDPARSPVVRSLIAQLGVVLALAFIVGACASPAPVASPTGVGRALATYDIPIEGRDEWVAAARRLA